MGNGHPFPILLGPACYTGTTTIAFCTRFCLRFSRVHSRTLNNGNAETNQPIQDWLKASTTAAPGWGSLLYHRAALWLAGEANKST